MSDAHRQRRRASAGTAACAARSSAPPSGRASSCSARTAGIEAQLIDDLEGKTLAAASWLHLKKRSRASKTEQAAEVGKLLAANAKKAGRRDASSSTAAATSTTDA